MNTLLKGMIRRYVILLGLFLAFLIFVLNTQSDEGLFSNILVTFLLLAAIPGLFYLLIKKKSKSKKLH